MLFSGQLPEASSESLQRLQLMVQISWVGQMAKLDMCHLRHLGAFIR